MAKGDLVGDDVMIGIVRERLARPDAAAGFVLDGFPRTVAQAEALDEMLDAAALLIIVDIEVPHEALVERLSARRICASCGALAAPGATTCHKCGGPLIQRQDDTADVSRDRLRVYARETQPLVDFYRPRPTFRAVDGDQPPDGVARDIAAAIAAVQGAQR
jgi:adenylate kinase